MVRPAGYVFTIFHMGSAYSRRIDLLLLVEFAELMRAGNIRHLSKNLQYRIVVHDCAALGGQWTGELDRNWVQDQLAEVAAEPGKTSLGDYFRWRIDGVPVWALVAANMCPLVDSRKPIRWP